MTHFNILAIEPVAAIPISIVLGVSAVLLAVLLVLVACRREGVRKVQKKEKKKGRIKAWWQRHKPSKRRLIQVYAALLFNANLKGLITGKIYTGNTKYLCVPGLNCYSCPAAAGACPLGALQNALAQSGASAPHYVLGILALFGLLLGRTICGFLCPVGLGQELLYKIKTPKLKKSRFTRILSYLKYVILAVFVIAIPLIYGMMDRAAGGPVPAFCKFICPAGTFGGAILLLIHPNNTGLYEMLGPLFTWKFCVLVVICVACVFIYRAFCRFLCPLGAIYGFFNRIALLGVKLDKGKCTDCGLCVSHCKMDVRRVGDHECINCGECIDVCPAKAITWKGSKIFLHANAVEAENPTPVVEKPLAPVLFERGAETVVSTDMTAEPAAEAVTTPAPERKPSKKRGKEFWLRVAAWGLALAVLLTALVYYNFFDKDGGQTNADADTGIAVGDTAPNFILGEYFSDSDFDLAATRGKIVVLNFWGTWCTPCIQEIPYFEQLAETYSEDVTVVFIHSNDVEEDVEAFIDEKGWSREYARFVQDSTERSIYELYGGNNVWPMTVILDREGKIAVRPQGSLEYARLALYIKNLLAAE